MNLPALMTHELSPQDLERHRDQILLLVEGVLDLYWQSRPADEVKAVTLSFWANALENYRLDEIHTALNNWASRQKHKPKPGDIVALMVGARAEKVSAPPEPEREPPCSPEQAEAIMAAAGFRPKTFPGDAA